MPTLVEKPPEGDGWIHEVKFDGYRSQIVRGATKGLYGICWGEEAVFVFLGRMQTDVKIVVAGRDDTVVGNEVSVLMSDLLMVARPQDDHVPIGPWCHGYAGDLSALTRDLVTMAASRWVGPMAVGVVGKCRTIVQRCSRGYHACQLRHVPRSDPMHRNGPQTATVVVNARLYTHLAITNAEKALPSSGPAQMYRIYQ